MSSFRTKLAIQFVATNGSTIVSFILSVILARLLDPSEIGIYSLTAAAVGFAHVFRDFGVASFIRQQKELTPELLRAAMGVLITSSWILAILLFMSSGWIADFFNQQGVKKAMQVVALGFLLIPFGAIPQSVLARDMQVEKNAFVIAVSTVVYFVSCITLAKLGFSYMSMAWANIINILASVFCYTLVRPAGMPWLPSFRGWSRVVNFGMGAMLSSAARAVDDAIADILLGRLSGPHLVGLFSRANSTVNILNYISEPTIKYIALPYFSKVHHRGEVLSKEIVLAVTYITGIIWPALIATAAFGAELIEVLYGKGWLESVSAVPWLCIVVGIKVALAFLQPALTGMGRPYLTVFPLVLVLVVKVATVLVFFDGSLMSFSRTYALAEIAAIPVYAFLAWRVLGMNASAWWAALHKSVLLSLVFAAALAGVWLAMQGITVPWQRLLCAFVTMFPVWLVAIGFFKHPLMAELMRLNVWVRKRRDAVS